MKAIAARWIRQLRRRRFGLAHESRRPHNRSPRFQAGARSPTLSNIDTLSVMSSGHRQSKGALFPAFVALSGMAMLCNGCQTPFSSDRVDEMFRHSVDRAVDRELRSAPAGAQRMPTTQPASEVERALSGRLAELKKIGPQFDDDEPVQDLGTDLTGHPQQGVEISLESAISTAVQRNLAAQIARVQPAINAADVVAAEAAFDALLFSNINHTKTDQPATVPVLGGVFLGTPFNAEERTRFETGVRSQLITGGSVSVSSDLTRAQNNTPGVNRSPDPAYTAAVRLGVTQPLLRNFGSDVNKASIRLARNTERRAIQDLRLTMLNLVRDVEQAYWDLVFAWRDLQIQQWLVEVGVPVRDRLKVRYEVFDAEQAEYADAVARVERRKADVIRAKRAVRAASDRLKSLMNDPQVTVGSEDVLRPLDDVVTQPISYSLRDAMMTAIRHRPEIQNAILEIDDASIRETLADNQRLPLLNISAEMDYFGLAQEAASSYNELFEARFIDYILSLNFEMPIGNRAAEAEFRRARLQRSAAVIGYRQAVQNAILDVKTALRDVITNYELIQATRSSRIAQAENLRALKVEEETMASLTPEFLDLKFTRQEGLAAARREELQALVNFDKSVAALYRAMGIGLDMNQITIEPIENALTAGQHDAEGR